MIIAQQVVVVVLYQITEDLWVSLHIPTPWMMTLPPWNPLARTRRWSTSLHQMPGKDYPVFSWRKINMIPLLLWHSRCHVSCNYHCDDLCVTSLSDMHSAIIEHTNQVIFLEDDDVAAVRNGRLTIHRIKRNFDDPKESTVREVITLKMEIQEIMKGVYRLNCCHSNRWQGDLLLLVHVPFLFPLAKHRQLQFLYAEGNFWAARVCYEHHEGPCQLWHKHRGPGWYQGTHDGDTALSTAHLHCMWYQLPQCHCSEYRPHRIIKKVATSQGVVEWVQNVTSQLYDCTRQMV